MSERISFTIDTALGTLTMITSPKGLVSLTLPPQAAAASRQKPPVELANLVNQLESYLSGKTVSFQHLDLDLTGATPFQLKAWRATRLIPYGETRSYKWVAGKIGQPTAVRAIGQALGKNPLPIIVPCHRVIASDGALGGYSGGLEIKQTLLSLEKGISQGRSFTSSTAVRRWQV